MAEFACLLGREFCGHSYSKVYCDHSGEGPWSTWDAREVMPLRLAREGPAGIDFCPPSTLMSLLTRAAELNGDEDAFVVERPLPALGAVGNNAPPALPREEWTRWTWKQYLADARAAARGFIQLGFKQYDTVNVWGFNSPEWGIAALAAGFAGGKFAGLYPTDSQDNIAYKIFHSGGSIVVIESKKQLDTIVGAIQALGDLKRVKAIVAYGFEPGQGEQVHVIGCGSVPLLSWKALIDMDNSPKCNEEIDRRVALTEPGNCACLVYTSGTTGEPKAVMTSHDNLVYQSSTLLSLMRKSVAFGASGQERCLSYLPLSHIAGMLNDIIMPVSLSSSQRGSWYTVFFARNYDLKAGSLPQRIQAVRPTSFLAVPLVWEKIADKIRTVGAGLTGVDTLVDIWADSIGLDQCKFAFTGAAPMRKETLEYFGSLGMNINESYGMSESTGPCTFSFDGARIWGSCGVELPGTEVRAFEVGPVPHMHNLCPVAPNLDCQNEIYEGELCFRGRGIMMGYMANPELGPEHMEDIREKNALAVDKDGWLHSGDKGMITAGGFIKITGRFKELIIGEGGENIAPVPIEAHIKEACDGISEVVIIGDKRKYNVALVTLKAVNANGESAGTDQLDAGAERLVEGIYTISAAMKDANWIAAVQEAITSANNDPTCCKNAAFKVQKFTILPTNFSIEAGELTPTRKLKRVVVENHFKDIIEKMYSTSGVYIPYN